MSLRHRVAVSAAVAATAVTAVTTAIVTGSSPAGAAPTCATVPVTVLGASTLRTLGAQDTLSSAQPTAAYTDLAYSGDGASLYGIPATLAKIDVLAADGSVARSVTLATDNPATGKAATAATGLPNGRVLVGGGTALYEVIPADGRSVNSDFKLPAGTTLTGDLARLPDGDVVAALGGGKIARLHPDGTSVVVGSLNNVTGLAVSGSRLLAVTSDGTILALGSVPTAASAAALDTSTVKSGGGAYSGAASIQSAGECNIPTATNGTVNAPAGATTSFDALTNSTTGGTGTTFTSVVLLDAASVEQGSLSMNRVGEFAVDGTSIGFTPADGFSGSTPAVTYRVTNSAGQSATATVVFRVQAAATTSASSGSSSGSSGSASSTGANNNDATSSEITPTAVPAGFDKPSDDTGLMLALGGVSLLLIAGAGTSLLRSRRRQH